MPGGICWASSGERRRLATLPPPMRCTTVSGEMSSGVPIGTSALALLPERETFYSFYRGNIEKTTLVYKAMSAQWGRYQRCQMLRIAALLKFGWVEDVIE